MFEFLHITRNKPPVNCEVPTCKSQLPRLINMRVKIAKKCGCDRCFDLLTKLHFSGKKFVHQHDIEQWGLTFWLAPSYVTAACIPCEANHKAYADISMEESLHHTKCKDLQDIEKEWKYQNDSTCDYKDNDEYWRKHWQDVKHVCELEYEDIEDEEPRRDLVAGS